MRIEADTQNLPRLTEANVVTVVGAILMVITFCCMLASRIIDDDTWLALMTFVIGVAFGVYVLLWTLGRRLTLFEDRFESRDWLFRTRVIPYGSVEAITFHRRSHLIITLTGEETLTWPARTAGIEEFIRAFSERVTRIHPIRIAGDLELDD